MLVTITLYLFHILLTIIKTIINHNNFKY